MNTKKHIVPFLAALICFIYAGFGCGGGGGSGSGCNPSANTGCEDGKVCEFITSGKVGCFDPVVVKGSVFNLSTKAAIEGARVVARDANGAVSSSVATTDAEGNYQLEASVLRDEEGNPASGESITLRADASGYQTFPGGVRQALPIDVTTYTDVAASANKADQLVIDTELTDIGLIALEAGAGTGSIFGTVELPEDTRGALVVAELSATEGYTAIADLDGNYRIFNLPAGTYAVKAYVQNVNYTPGTATLADGDNYEVNLSLNDDAAAKLLGKVNIVNPGAGNATSIILVVESTFDANLVRGETPPGLRAPAPGIAPDVNGAFTIEGIPAGRYVILAAFENDYLVRDPDTCISGTAILHQEFTSGQTVDLSNEAFKITGSLDVISPGASGPESVNTTTPTLTWVDDSSEENYSIIVLDSFGNVVWQTTIAGTSGTNPSIVYNFDGTGQNLQSGMYYQFRAISTRTSGSNTCEISQTEDLKGVFYVE